MGAGGRVVLVNGTKSRWRKTYHHTYQMNHFEFPDTIQPGTSVLCYIEWNQHFGKNPKDDKGEVIYEVEGTGSSFQIGAQAQRGFNIYIKYDNFSNLQSSLLNLGFVHNGHVTFCLSGEKGKFIASSSHIKNPLGASDWISNNFDLLSGRVLRDLCLPGSHDSGMSSIHSPTAFVTKENTQTQALEIREQLMHGIRYFDIRPIIGGGVFHTGHYSKVGPGWQGARGQDMGSIIAQINEFTLNRKELIILNLSESLNTDLCNFSYRAFNQEEYDRLFDQLKNIRDLFVTPNDRINLLDKPLSFFLKDKSAVVCVLNDNASLNSFYHKGFYPKEELSIVDKFANTDNLDKMINDQLQKLSSNRSNGQNKYFLLSWTLTLQTIQNITGPSIEFLADKANSNIFRLILDSNFRSLIKKGYPNIIIQDYVTSELTAIALALNLFKDDSAFFITIDEDKPKIEELSESSELNCFQYYGLKAFYAIVSFVFMIIGVITLFIFYYYIQKPNLSLD